MSNEDENRDKHDRYVAACDDAADQLVAAITTVDRDRILKLMRDANQTVEQCERYIFGRIRDALAEHDGLAPRDEGDLFR